MPPVTRSKTDTAWLAGGGEGAGLLDVAPAPLCKCTKSHRVGGQCESDTSVKLTGSTACPALKEVPTPVSPPQARV